MFDTVTTLDILYLATGLYVLAVAIGMLLKPADYANIVTELRDAMLPRLLFGTIAFLIGVTILALNHDWSGIRPGVMTAIGWLSLLRGVLILAVPQVVLGVAGFFVARKGLLRLAPLFMLPLGLALFWTGLAG